MVGGCRGAAARDRESTRKPEENKAKIESACSILKEAKPRNDTGTVDPVVPVPVILYGKLTMHWCEEKQH